MREVAIIGAGKIGVAIARLLHESGDYAVCVADREAAALERLGASLPVQTQVLDATDEAAMAGFLRGRAAVLSACPFDMNPPIARAAQAAGCSYFDLTEDRATTAAVRTVAEQAVEGQVFMPQCGLAPGFISILAYDLCQRFERLEEVKMRVGALPRYPSNMMLYNLTWSTDGLINEYCNPCDCIREGKVIETLALEGLELFSLDGNDYEAFNTSGGLGTLTETLRGKVRSLDYKTVRYQGHRTLMHFLINDLRLGHRRELLKEMLENAVPMTLQDVILIFVTVSGHAGGRFLQHSDARKIYSRELFGEPWSSIQITTAAGICAALDLYFAGKLPARGFVKQEAVTLEDFQANRFGRHYTTGEPVTASEVQVAPAYDGSGAGI